MWVGAFLGAIVAMVILMLVALQSSGRAARVLGPLASGDRAGARRALDRMAPALAVVATSRDAARVRERWAGLALLGELSDLRAEVAALTGADGPRLLALGLGQLALALVGPAPKQAAAALAALLDEAEATPAVSRSVREALRESALVAAGLAGARLGILQLAAFKRRHAHPGLVAELAKRITARLTAARLVAAAG